MKEKLLQFKKGETIVSNADEINQRVLNIIKYSGYKEDCYFKTEIVK